jgi:hypothetical protein
MSAKKPKSKQETQIELHPDGWKRFEQAVDAAVKNGPQHRSATPKRPKAKRA